MQKNEFIKQIRKKYKMSQKTFAELLEVSKSLIEKVEMGKIEATPENKYVKAVCALEGLDNEIFKYDEITDEVLQKHELSKFSKAFRKFLYFYYGDFFSKDFVYDFIDTYISYIEEAVIRAEIADFSIAGEFYGGDWTYYVISNFPKNTLYDVIQTLTLPKLKQTLDSNLITFFEIMSILTINELNKELKFALFNFTDKSHKYFDFLKNNNSLSYLQEYYNIFHCESIDRFLILEKLSKYAEIDTILSVENIKKLKKLKEIEKIKKEEELKEVIEALDQVMKTPEKLFNQKNNSKNNDNIPTDPKDKQICELLQYAPPAFKDKIIEKLLQYKKDVEEF